MLYEMVGILFLFAFKITFFFLFTKVVLSYLFRKHLMFCKKNSAKRKERPQIGVYVTGNHYICC